jgi:hypothetical protein
MTQLIAGLVYFVAVFAKAFQQRNVAFVNYKMVMPISYLLAFADVTVIGLVAHTAVNTEGWVAMAWMAFAVGTGGGLGAISAMFLHHKHFTHERFK